jgi:Zn finger protein HypA/HybF involved in hydrogenase expression
MPSDEAPLQGYCVKCKRLFEVKWAENLCPSCEEVVDDLHLDGLTSAL